MTTGFLETFFIPQITTFPCMNLGVEIIGLFEKVDLWYVKNMAAHSIGHPVSKIVLHLRGAIGYMRPIHIICQNCASNRFYVHAVQNVQL